MLQDTWAFKPQNTMISKALFCKYIHLHKYLPLGDNSQSSSRFFLTGHRTENGSLRWSSTQAPVRGGILCQAVGDVAGETGKLQSCPPPAIYASNHQSEHRLGCLCPLS